MKHDVLVEPPTLTLIGDQARELEQLGYDGLLVAETKRDPFLPLAVAAQATRSLNLASCVAVAFSRSPMHLAQLGHDLQHASRGRFVLGLGPQIRPHIERRFGVAWSEPVARMRELVEAVRAIWRSWNEGGELCFEGRFYRHTLMPPFFNPGPTGYGPPPVFLGAVGRGMTEVAGEVADGLFLHTFITPRYVREVTVPALLRGASRAQRDPSTISLGVLVFAVTGVNDEELDSARLAVREHIAFYATTPAYRPVLELEGLGDLQTELHALARSGRWTAMTELITNDIVDLFAVEGPLDDLFARVGRRFHGVGDRVAFYTPYRFPKSHWASLLDRSGAPAASPSGPRDLGEPV